MSLMKELLKLSTAFTDNNRNNDDDDEYNKIIFGLSVTINKTTRKV